MKIVLLIDAEVWVAGDPQLKKRVARKDTSMERQVAHALRVLGHDVLVLAFASDALRVVQELRGIGPDLVFNLTEHLAGDRNYDHRIAALLELFGIPFTGCGSVGLAVCRDKAMSKHVVRSAGFFAPRFVTVGAGEVHADIRNLTFPLLVKPRFGDGSDTLARRSMVTSKQALDATLRAVRRRTDEGLIIEQFVEGRELKVLIAGNAHCENGSDLKVFPIGEIVFGKSGRSGPCFQTSRVKHDAKYRRKWGIRYTRPTLEPRLRARLNREARQMYLALRIRGYGRIDARLTERGDFVFLEANPNPSIGARGIAEVLPWCGTNYLEFLQRIVTLGIEG